MVQGGMEGTRDPGKLLCRRNIRAEHSRKRAQGAEDMRW